MANSQRNKKANEQGALPDTGRVLEAVFAALENGLRSAPSREDILGIEDAAKLMRCSVDTLRRIPSGELPVYRVGRENLYLREEIIRFVRSRPVQNADVEAVLAEVLDCVDQQIPVGVDSDPVDVRRRSKRRAS